MTTTRTTYPDTKQGVIDFMRAETCLTPKTFTPDPHYAGCWEVVCTTGERAIVYIGDHPYSGDFEVAA